jgi:diguanylate cyclase (GGDEF)-like protein
MGRIKAAMGNPVQLACGSLVAALAVAGAALVVSGSHLPAVEPVVLFAALSIAAENLALRHPARATVSPQMIMVLAAVVALGGRGEVLGAMAVGATGGLVLTELRRRHWASIAFNIGQLALCAAGAAVVFHLLTTADVPSFVKYPATVVTLLTGNAVFVLQWAATRPGPLRPNLGRELRSTFGHCFVLGLVGMLIGDLYLHAGSWTLVAIIGPVVVARTVFWSIVGFRQAYSRLEVLYGFSQQLERIRDEPDAASRMLAELRSSIGTHRAEIVVLTSTGWRRTALDRDSDTPTVTDGVGLPAEIDGVQRGPRLILRPGGRDRLTEELTRRELCPAIVAPLRSDAQIIGAIVVSGPRDGHRLDADDLKLLETLANHAATSLENTRLLDQLRYDSRHDGLTGLPNRARFNELVASLPLPSAVLLVDLDRFQEINDTLGHAYGDLLLQRVAERLTAKFGRRGIVARLGGDEFGVLLPRTRASEATGDAVTLLEVLEQPFEVEDLRLEVTASIGVSVALSADDDTDKLLQQADVAMYSAKTSHSGWELYDSDRDHYSRRRLTLASELRAAIDGDELVVHYQPKASLRDGTVVGVEALVRWEHPTWGLISPDMFIPVAEQAGLIRPLTLLVLSAAASQHRFLRTLGFDIDVAVNLSVRSVLDVNLPDQVADVLADHDMSADSLTLEITETSVMADPARTIGVLGRLAQLGTSISIDDFGTGYSSLSYLKRLPASEVKIDRSFIAGMASGASDLAIVRSTVDLARNLGLKAVAEGVEDTRTWARLTELGCDQAQGFYLSRPLPAAALSTWLTDRVGSPAA